MSSESERTLTKPLENLLAGQGRLNASLIVLTGSSIGKMFRIEKAITTIGRALDCDVVLDDESISRQHARLVKSEKGIDMVDLGSKNGTLLNGDRVTEVKRLTTGDKLQLGSETILKFSVQDMLDEAVQRLLYDSAIRDGLTGAFNRKFLDEALQKDFAFGSRHDAPISLLMMDVDHFKLLNDSRGHAAGDLALVSLVQSVHEAIRTEDLFARYGGEEFALVLREVNEEVAVAVAERLRQRIEELPLDFEGKPMQITVSIGVATHSQGRFASVEEFLATADRYLLRAKLEGRNRVRAKSVCGG
ncbi:MAG: GGDEF domain-containing protein [Myxococcales bacterium]|nr:GGDEF domain-containing protein [Myxococcales bacterium]